MTILINAQGLVNHTAYRAARDGYTYFGRKKNIKRVNNSDHDHESTTKVSQVSVIFAQKQIVNDFIIPSKNAQSAE